MHAIHRCENYGETIKFVAEDIGYSTVSVWKWIQKYTEKGSVSLNEPIRSNIPINPRDIRLADDINVLRNDPGVNQEAPSNREKAVIIDALKNKYSLPKLCRKLYISRSSYYHQETAMRDEDKYRDVRIRICELFHNNYDVFGYRKKYAMHKREGTNLSEKVVRRIMREEGLVTKVHHRRKYNSYKGEISPAVDNLINRGFHADKPDQKWLTDITGFSIEVGKVYLPPIIDCLDGMPVSWTVGTSPNAKLVNAMLEQAIKTLKLGEHPIIHSDRGCHYRWPDWIKIMEDAKLTRSMSKKAAFRTTLPAKAFSAI